MLSDHPQGEGWWEASDRKWYPPESHSDYQPPPPAPAPPPPPSPPGGQPPPPGGYTQPMPVAPQPDPKKPWYLKPWVIIAGVVLLGLILIGALAPGDDDGSGEVATATSAPATTAPTSKTTIDPDVEAIASGNVALCNDGGYSDNTDFRATCSGGDGVDHWLATYGECNDGRAILMSSEASCLDNDGFKELKDPDFEPTAGPDDVALCANALYSDNTDFAATCNSNGGVETWLSSYVECTDGTVLELNEDTDCDPHDGFKQLMPSDYSPPTTPKPTAPPPHPPAATEPKAPDCHPSYFPCVPPPPPLLNCSEIGGPVLVEGNDPHDLDRDGDGIACEN